MKNCINNLKDRVKENFVKNKVLLVVFAVAWTIIILISNNAYKETIGKQSIGNESYNRSVVEVNNNTIIKEVVPIEEDADNLSVLFATYARNNSGKVTITINGDTTKHLYAKKIIDVNNIVDNDYVTLKLDENLNTNKEEKVIITISSDSEEGKAVGVYYSNTKEFEDGLLFVNDEEIEDADMCFKFLVYNKDLNMFAENVVGWSIFGITLIAIFVLLINPKEEILFALVILIFGLIMMIIIVPASPPDELSHYEIELQVSNLLLGEDTKTIDSIYLKYGYMYGHYNISPGYIRFLNEFGKTVKLTGEIQNLNRNYQDLYWIQYMPNVIGLTIGRLLKLNMITTFYLGRFTGLLFYIACVYIAIKKAPSYKYIIGFISSMPMFIQTSISLTYDTWILGLSFLSIGIFLNWFLLKKKIEIKEYIFAFIVCLALAPAKVLYSFFAFLFIFVPYSNYGGKLKKIIFVLILIAPAIWQLYGIMIGAILQFIDHILYSGSLSNLLSEENGVSDLSNIITQPKEQFSIKYMIKYPMDTMVIFARTVRYKIKYWFYGSIGRTLSGETLILPIRLVHFLIVVPIISVFVKQDMVLPLYMRIIFILMCVAIGLYAMIGMFVSWSSPGQEIIEDYGGMIVEGIQGRYFSPVLPFFFSAFPNNKIKLSERVNKYLILGYLVIFYEIVLYVLSYTFVN